MTHAKNKYMALAFEEAEAAAARGEIPVGAVIVDSKSGEIISSAGNYVEARNDPTAHAEIVAIQRACQKLRSKRLPECDLYVTLEPCPLCATAISFARIRRLYYGAYDPKSGGVDHGPQIFQSKSCHHCPEIYSGYEERRSKKLLQDFFKKLR